MPTKVKPRNVATTSQKHARLKVLGKAAAKNIYDMLRLADEILADHEYADRFGGEADLIAMLENEEFQHFGGNPKLSSMLRAFRANPKLATWEEYRFNIRAMIELSEPAKDGADVERINWKALAKELQAKLESAEAVVAELRTANGELRTRADAATTEAAELRGRLSAVEGMLRQRAA